jgi:molybdopterin molybdotransferase
MLPVEEALSIILDLVQPLDGHLDTEVVELSAATGRILASPVTSELDFPHWDNSAMDGYAVRYADVATCNSENPAILEIIEEIPAGYQPQKSLLSGQASRILTGACLPEGADTVVMQERTKREENRIYIMEAPKLQAFVRHRGEFYQAGKPLLQPGTKLGAPEMAVLAAAQCTQLSVYRRPRVAILSTGDELVTPYQLLQPGQIVDSNQYALAAFVVLSGAIPVVRGIVPDQPKQLEEAIAQAIASADIVLSTGGVSVGDYDYVEQILAELGGEIHIRAVRIKPGKPLTIATFTPQESRDQQQSKHRILYFGLPGNPVSALVTCWRFVQPALSKLSGLPKSAWDSTFVQAQTRQDLRSDGGRETYLWGRLNLNAAGVYEFDLAGGSHSSGNLINLVQTNGLAVVPVGQTLIAAGEVIKVLKL